MTSMPLTLSRMLDGSMSSHQPPDDAHLQEQARREPASLGSQTLGPPGAAARRSAPTGRCGSSLAQSRVRQLLLGGVLVGGGLDHRLDDLLVGLHQSDVKLHFVPSQVWMRAQARPMWSAHEVEIGRITPAKPSASSFFWSSVRFSRPQRTCSPVITLPLPKRSCARAHAFDAEHRAHHAAHVEHLADLLLRPGALALVVHHASACP